ncbi:MAG: ribosome-associated translation inhibitor RaiA [Deltaproteobacteria bacterium]|nr:ribosome-associated translation inhibitor RaiA [Deltaproteobacteria bacterium]
MSEEGDVSFKITFRNFQSSPALSEYIKKRFLSVFRRFHDKSLVVNVTLNKKNLCIGEVSAHFPNFTLVASIEDKDFYLVVDKLKNIIREQLRRHKEKLINR